MKTEAKVGLFVALGLLFAFLLTTQVNNFQGVGRKGYKIDAYVQDASGLENHAKVKMRGVEIGYVEGMGLADKSVRLRLFIDQGVKIPSDSAVKLEQASMLGGKYVSIIPGQSENYLANSGALKRSLYTASLEQMGSEVASAAAELKQFIHELRQTLNEQSREQLRHTFANLEQLTKDLKEVVAKNRENLTRMVENINGAAVKFGKMSEKFAQSADTINADLPGLMAKLEETIDAYKGAGKTLDRRLPTLADKFESLEDDLDAVVQENRKPLNKALLSVNNFFTSGEKTMYKINRYLDAVTQSKLELGMDAFYMANDNDYRGSLHVDYMPYYTRHYMLDVVSTPNYGEQLDDGTYLGELDHEENDWYVSAQVGKRYRDFMIRGGLIENTAGGGIDYYWNHDRWKLSLDAFDFNAVNDLRGTNAHLRATLRYRFYKYLNAYVGYDNFLNSSADNLFFGLGIRFEDERMKYLLGAGAGAAGALK